MQDDCAPGGDIHGEVLDVMRSVASLYRPRSSYHMDGMAIVARLERGARVMDIMDRDCLDPLKAACFAVQRLETGLGTWPADMRLPLLDLHQASAKALEQAREQCVFQGEIVGYLSGKPMPMSELSERSDSLVRRFGGIPVDHPVPEAAVTRTCSG